ncbi:EpsG family protein [Salegentibacter agarivorans]|uniref:EpsG family protein n=1 Tax=Salegentibacter agarivorans TaxID=345907 RepID=A0A1I2K1Q2_9FLAO|nr:EpsG family protein [Salegentibacter agarivorans]SFF60283.1 EpsG family protein [Salegentibacter agarivorans]
MELFPIHIYTPIYYQLLFAIVFITAINTFSTNITTPNGIKFAKMVGGVAVIYLLLIMGLRPISYYFGDMGTYNNYFERYQSGEEVLKVKDGFFYAFMKFCSYFMNAQFFFFLCASLYILPIYLACKKWFSNYWGYGFLMIISVLTFWAYGTNGIRNGLATSVFIYALSRDKLLFKALWMFLAVNIHTSIAIPILAYLIIYFKNNPSLYLKIWFLAIPLSLVGGGFWESLFLGFGFEEDRMQLYLANDEFAEQFSQTGFRWDFLLYSSTGVFAGYYYIFKKKFKDKNYRVIYQVFVITNSFWILVIRAGFSNRFAYLSWFLLGLVIIYPLLKKKFLINQHNKIGLIISASFLFTYLLEVIL